MINSSELEEIINYTKLPEEITQAPILITGGTGFIGSWLVAVLNKMLDKMLIENPIYVLTSDKAKAECVFSSPRYKKIVVYTLEELKEQVLNRSIKGFGYVFHCATSTKYSTNDEKNDFNRSLDLTIRILEIIKLTGSTPNFINLSSGAVYESPISFSRLAELNSPVNYGSSLSLYGELKVKTEQLVVSADIEGLINGSNPRLFTFYGYGLPLDSHFAIGNFIQSAATRNKIEVTGSPQTVRSYLYITDLVVQLLSLLTKPTLNTIHIGGASEITMGELASKVSEHFNNCPVIISGKDTQPTYYLPEVAGTVKYLNVKERILLDVGLTRWKETLVI
jgi:nucleoside-diphosphate-sugar epimerase